MADDASVGCAKRVLNYRHYVGLALSSEAGSSTAARGHPPGPTAKIYDLCSSSTTIREQAPPGERSDLGRRASAQFRSDVKLNRKYKLVSTLLMNGHHHQHQQQQHIFHILRIVLSWIFVWYFLFSSPLRGTHFAW